MDFNLLKLEGSLAGIRKLATLEELRAESREWAEDPSPERHQPERFPALCEQLAFAPFAWHERWGAAHESRVFRVKVSPPPGFAGKPAFLRVTTGREGGYTAFNPQFFAYVNGRLIQGMDINHTLLPLPAAREGEGVEVLLHAFAGTEPGLIELHTHLARFDEQGLALYHAFLAALETLKLQVPGSAMHAELELALLAACDLLDFSAMAAEETAREECFAAALALLEERVYGRDWGQNPAEVYAIGHTHIDIAWRWTAAQTRQKAQRSFATAVQLMEQYPEYRFFSAQPVLYQFVKEDNPALYARIRQLAKQGRWEAEGGMWLEADCNLPSGESLVRQIYYGKKFLLEEFGVDSRILWMPDSFGYSPVIPQLMAQSGLKYFATSKLSWNEFNRVPHDVFEWTGPDGSSVLACMITSPDDQGLPNSPDFSTYNATLQPKNVAGVIERMNAKRLTRAAMMPYGYGDGGGGPTLEMLESARRMMRGLPGLPRLNLEGARAFFSRLDQDLAGQKPPRVQGELYLEFHRGTYTSVASIKRQNRRMELAMAALELALAISGHDEAKERETLWKTMALHQFHDVLPGSAIREVYAAYDAEHGQMMARARDLMLRAQKKPGQEEADTLCVINPLWASLPQVLLLEGLDGKTPMLDGRPLPAQALRDGRTAVYAEGLPAMGVQAFQLGGPALPAAAAKEGGDARRLENRFFTLELDGHGEIRSLVDKRRGRELVRPGAALNALKLFEDRPASCDAWNIDVNYVEKMWPVQQADEIVRWEDGPVCSALMVKRSFRHSTVTQVIRLYEELPRVDLEYTVDWQERQMLLKAAFPLDIHALQARCGIQYGFLDRPMTQNTPWEAARFEICAHRFIDLSEPDYGVTLLLGDKYGADLLDGQVRVTLLKAPVDPWPEADRGRHTFTLSLLPHEGNAFEADVYTQAAVPDRAQVLCGAGPAAGTRFSLAESLTRGVALEALKPAEDGDGLILRVNEYEGRRCLARVRLGRSIRSAQLCGLMENPLETLRADGNILEVPLMPRQILTIRLKLREEAPSAE